MKRNITCLCSANFQFEYNDEIDLDVNPKILEEISKGTFMSSTCPACNKNHKPEFNISLIWKSKNLKMNVIPELERGEFYRNKKDVKDIETIISYPEMADRLAVIKDDLEPVVIETLKSFILAKAAENYPDKDINAWYHCNTDSGVEFHLDGIRVDEIAVMRIPKDVYEKTLLDYKKHPKNTNFTSLRVRSYMSVQNILRPDALK
ncbi:MAG: hypothetical protein FWD47_11940 [Treponema sp.]|nr:hypothetical protein [Treponema sp.]